MDAVYEVWAMVLGLNGRGVVVVCAVFLFTPHAWAQTGACCLNDTGACISATEADCNGSLQGAWQGAGMTCADDMPCSTTYGACCLPDECRTAPMFVCSVLANEGAEFMGEGVACHETTYAETVLGDGHWIDMTGATPIVFVDDESGFGTTDEGMAQVTLPAPYVFDSVSYSAGATVWVHTNGFVSFDIIDVTNRPDTFNFRLEFSADASTPNGAICPLWSDQNNTTARTKTVMQGADTVLVIEWDTTPFSAESFGGKYQLHLITTGGTGADEIRVVYRETMGGATPFDGLLAEDNRLFVGAHSVGGLSVFRRDVASLRTLIDSGAHGLLFTPTGTETPCDVNVCAADFNNDGDVDLGDFGTFGAAFNSVTGDANYNADADFNGDGDVDLGDFGTFGSEFNRVDCIQ